MKNEISEETKIVMGRDRMVTKKTLYEEKINFHKEQARLPFEEKIKMLVKLQEIAVRIKGSDKMIWKS